MNKLTGLALLAEHLERFHKASGNDWHALCPVPDHGDTNPSLVITLKEEPRRLVLHCWGCGANGDQVCAALGLKRGRVYYGSALGEWDGDPDCEMCRGSGGSGNGKPADPNSAGALFRRRFAIESLTPALITEWHETLFKNESESLVLPERIAASGFLLNSLCEWRGLTAETVRRFRLGWCGTHGALWPSGVYTLPVYEGDRLVNVRHCELEDSLRGLPHRTSLRLHPDVPKGRWVLLVEGEWDALIGRQHGLPTLTTTGGAYGWPTSLSAACSGRSVAITLDSDQTGRQAAQKLAQRLCGVAAEVRVVDLMRHSDDYDLTNWFRDDKRTKTELLALLRHSAPTDSAGVG